MSIYSCEQNLVFQTLQMLCLIVFHEDNTGKTGVFDSLYSFGNNSLNGPKNWDEHKKLKEAI